MNEKTTLKNAELYKEDGRYYLKLTYIVENASEIAEITCPKVELPLIPDKCIINHSTIFYGIVDPPKILLYNDVELTLFQDKKGMYYTKKVLEQKTHELTLDEIEKKLGYKVKIVNKKK